MPSDKKNRVLLIDGNYLIFRSYFAYPLDSFYNNNKPTNAIYGFLAILLKLITELKVHKVGIAFDVSSKTFRKDIYPEYKAGRKKTQNELLMQIPTIHEMVSILGITYVMQENYEGDDLIASVASKLSKKGEDIFIYSADKDIYQLVSNNITALKPQKGATQIDYITKKRLFEIYKLTPCEYRDFAAIVGETADNLIGAKGIGPKTATNLIHKYKTLDGIYNNLDDLKTNLKTSLQEAKNRVYMNKKLNKLIVNLKTSDNYELSKINMKEFNHFFNKLGFKTLPQRVIDSNIFNIDISETIKYNNTNDEQNKMVNSSENNQNKKLKVVPIYNSETVCVVGNKVIKNKNEIKKILENNQKKIVYNLKSLLHYIKQDVKANNIFDLLLASYLTNSTLKIKNYNDFNKQYSGQLSLFETDDEEKNLIKIANSFYNIYSELKEKIEQINGSELLNTIEIPLSTILYKMEQKGISVNVSKLTSLAFEQNQITLKAKNDAISIIGEEINLNSPKQLQEILFSKLKMPKTKKIKTGYTTDSNALSELFVITKNIFLEKLLIYRDSVKKSQIINTLQNSIRNDKKIHTTFLQTGTATGRLASENPNLQNVPIKSEIGQLIRDSFIPEKVTNIFISADYSQIEMRIIAHFSNDTVLINAFKENQDLHKVTASKVYKIPIDSITDVQRNNVKSLVYGLAYGLGVYGLANTLKISNIEAKQLKDDFFYSFPNLKTYLQSLIDNARKMGYTQTLFGRRRYIPEINSINQIIKSSGERIAQNTPIQGSAADIIKKAMIDISNALPLDTRILLQIHDELIIECPITKKDMIIKIVKEKMENVCNLKVPLVANIGYGKTWKDAQH